MKVSFLFIIFLGLHDAARLTVFKGKIENFKNYPFIVLLSSGVSICTGSLVRESLVLTAAHCICSKNPPKEAYFLRNDIRKATGFSVGVKKLLTDPFYKECEQRRKDLIFNHYPVGTDLGFVFLQEKVLDEPTLRIVSIHMSSQISNGTKLLTIGYGTDDSLKTNNLGILRTGHIYTDNCPIEIEFNPLCAIKSKRNFQINGPGDSGGPLYKQDANEIVGCISGIASLKNEIKVLVYASFHSRRGFIKNLLASV